MSCSATKPYSMTVDIVLKRNRRTIYAHTAGSSEGIPPTRCPPRHCTTTTALRVEVQGAVGEQSPYISSPPTARPRSPLPSPTRNVPAPPPDVCSPRRRRGRPFCSCPFCSCPFCSFSFYSCPFYRWWMAVSLGISSRRHVCRHLSPFGVLRVPRAERRSGC